MCFFVFGVLCVFVRVLVPFLLNAKKCSSPMFSRIFIFALGTQPNCYFVALLSSDWSCFLK